MEIKKTESLKVYYKSFKTTLKEIWKYVKDTPQEMYDNLEKYGLAPAGPQIWCYYGSDGNPETTFVLEIAIPVQKLKEIDGMQFKELESLKCASLIHKGPWENLKQSYEELIEEIYKSGKSMGKICREIYINCDFENPENNITEIQIEIN